MIIVIKNDPDKKQMDNLVKWIKGLGLDIHMSKGDNSTVMGLIGDTSVVDEDLIRSLDIVESVKRIQEPFKNANRKFIPRTRSWTWADTSSAGDISSSSPVPAPSRARIRSSPSPRR